jgi:hypothetical protein
VACDADSRREDCDSRRQVMSVGRSGTRAVALGGLVVLVLAAFGGSSAWAEPSTYCVKATKVSKIISGKTKHVFTGGFNDKGCTSVNGTHEGKFDKIKPSSFTEAEEQELKALLKSEVKALLKYTKVEESGVGGKPTVQFSGTNVQVVNGLGQTNVFNGEGNLVIGYDENTLLFRGKPAIQTGSHNLILGEDQEYTSEGGILAGSGNSTTGFSASVTGGFGNTASGAEASVSGGENNIASQIDASVSGGAHNKASALWAWIGGGSANQVFSNAKAGEEGRFGSIFGGKENKTAKDYEAIP